MELAEVPVGGEGLDGGPLDAGGYEPPVLAKHSGLAFPKQIWQGLNRGTWCAQCSSCHGCR